MTPHPDHHLWRNGRLYWAAFTIHVEGWRIERIRRSLGTANVMEARQRRDTLMEEYARQSGVALSLRPQATHGWPRNRIAYQASGSAT
jgi:hypothetical protein